MIVIGERINSNRKSIARALGEKDGDFFRDEAKKQIEAGANFVDVNCGKAGDQGCETMRWLIAEIRQATDNPLCIDSDDPKVILAGLDAHGPGEPMVNSTTAEAERLNQFMGLYKERPFGLVALAMEADDIPPTPQDRLSKVDIIAEAAETHGVPLSQVYVDPLMQPVSYEAKAALNALETLALMAEKYPEMRSVAGVSNVSFGLPGRALLNRTAIAMLMSAGLDAAIIDPLNVSMMSEVRAAEALLGQDEMCMNYIQAFRGGLLAV